MADKIINVDFCDPTLKARRLVERLNSIDGQVAKEILELLTDLEIYDERQTVIESRITSLEERLAELETPQ